MSIRLPRPWSVSILGLAFFVFGLIGFIAEAEPWISNRFAQNCAGCHAPGRFNQQPIGRRCTLSCQGCHVNPNGGGMRNQYGIWTQERWMRSFRTDLVKDDPIPAPTAYQPYMKKKKIRRTPPRMMAIRALDVDEKLYDKDHYDEWHHNVKNERQFQSTIPKGDPYWLERQMPLYASGDFRYFVINQSGDGVSEDYEFMNWPMAFDLGIRARPTKFKELSLVVESRFLNMPSNKDIDQTFTSQAQVRSAYALVDDLAYNSYVMGGLYRPMFGHFNPDHKSLAQEVSGLNQYSVYKAYGFGTAPNVPFLVANVIQPIRGSGNFSQDEGYVVSLGGRFVTLSASGKLSYWSTKAPDGSGNQLGKNMISATFGGMIGRYIGNFEFLRVEQEFAPGKKDAGNVYTAELKTKLWRENYLVTNYSTSNVTRSLKAGNAQEIMVGLKSFPISNTELEMLYILRNEKVNSTDTETSRNAIQLQTHIFF